MSKKTAHPFVTLRNFSKKINFFKKIIFLKFFDFDFKKWKNNSIVLLFYCFMGNAQKIRYLEIFRKKFFFSNFFFSKFFEIEYGIEEKYFYCSIVLLCHGQRPKNPILRNFSKNFFFQNFYFFKFVFANARSSFPTARSCFFSKFFDLDFKKWKK